MPSTGLSADEFSADEFSADELSADELSADELSAWRSWMGLPLAEPKARHSLDLKPATR